jgi:hypothetical protein
MTFPLTENNAIPDKRLGDNGANAVQLRKTCIVIPAKAGMMHVALSLKQ